LSIGGRHSTIADAKRIFQHALRCAATGLILCHNHPSGQRKPSPQDEALTKDIKEFASLIDMKLLDHVIFTDNGYFSFADEGIL
jgi:DNA repair protein RadC